MLLLLPPPPPPTHRIPFTPFSFYVGVKNIPPKPEPHAPVHAPLHRPDVGDDDYDDDDTEPGGYILQRQCFSKTKPVHMPKSQRKKTPCMPDGIFMPRVRGDRIGEGKKKDKSESKKVAERSLDMPPCRRQ